MTNPLRQVDEIFHRFHAKERVPGIAYGVVIGGELVHARGLGMTHANVDGPGAPDANSVFRIASMTKSFTAAITLLLRDEGALRLDEPVGTYVPELAGFKGPTTDSPLITLRHLLTMASGLPTDDPWGDRLQGMAIDRFAELMAGGFEFAWTPGTAFEYSNLGYGILGRVLTKVSGIEYRDLVTRRILEPLGMGATVYEAGDVLPEHLVQGHVRRADAYVDEPFDGYGALASMGGLFSSVRDLATWVAGFADAFPPRDDPEAGHPLSRATLREMQQAQRSFPPEVRRPDPAAAPTLDAGGYGFGLFANHELSLGHVVNHSGGYPGFGSHMRWHPASGIGVIALGNRTYAPMSRPATEALATLVTGEAAPRRTLVAWDATNAARADVESLIGGWDDDLAGRILADNVDLDEPLERRRATFAAIAETHGRLTRDEDEPSTADSPAHLVWWMRGERSGRVRIEIQMSPERPSRVQDLDVRSVPEPPRILVEMADRVEALINDDGPVTGWPGDLVPSADGSEDERATDDRGLRAAAAMFAPVTVGSPTAGDGSSSATFPLVGERGSLSLELTVDQTTGELTERTLAPIGLRPPTEP
jgi:CubicO group peptidase (beta-lactamase class C family)